MSWLINTNDLALCICHQPCQPHTITDEGWVGWSFRAQPILLHYKRGADLLQESRKLFHSELVARQAAAPRDPPAIKYIISTDGRQAQIFKEVVLLFGFAQISG